MSSGPSPQIAAEMPAADQPTTTTSYSSQPTPVQYQSSGMTYQGLPIPIDSTNQPTAIAQQQQQQQQQLSGATGVVYQELPTSNTTVMSQGQDRGVVYQELPTSNTTVMSQGQDRGEVYQELPTASQITTTVYSDPLKIDTHTPARVLSDQFPTAVPYQHPPPDPIKSPSYSVGATSPGGYYAPAPDEKTATTTTTTMHYPSNQGVVGGYAPPQGGVGYYQPQQQIVSQPIMQPYGQDLANPVMGHAGVVVPSKPPKKMVNCCGRLYTQQTVVVLSTLAALIVILVIGLGAGLGIRSSNRVTYYYY